MSSDNTVPDPRLEVLEYLNAHPCAADTLDGIVQWWLPIQRYQTAKDIIQKALDDLVQQGLVDYVETGDGRRIFRLREFPIERGNNKQEVLVNPALALPRLTSLPFFSKYPAHRISSYKSGEADGYPYKNEVPGIFFTDSWMVR